MKSLEELRAFHKKGASALSSLKTTCEQNMNVNPDTRCKHLSCDLNVLDSDYNDLLPPKFIVRRRNGDGSNKGDKLESIIWCTIKVGQVYHLKDQLEKVSLMRLKENYGCFSSIAEKESYIEVRLLTSFTEADIASVSNEFDIELGLSNQMALSARQNCLLPEIANFSIDSGIENAKLYVGDLIRALQASLPAWR